MRSYSVDNNKISGIYFLRSIKENAVYVGSSEDIEYRHYQHIHELKSKTHVNRYLQEIWNKDGQVGLQHEVVEHIKDLENLLDIEQQYIDLLKEDELNGGPRLLNMNMKATCPPSALGAKRKKETLEKLSIARKKLWADPIKRIKWLESFRVSHTPESRERSRISKKDKMVPVARINPKTGEIKIYESTKQVELDGFSRKAVSALTNGRKQRKSHKGFWWRKLIGGQIAEPIKHPEYVYDEAERAKKCIIMKQVLNTPEARQNQRSGKRRKMKSVMRIDPISREEKVYESIAEAGRCGFDRSSILCCIRGERVYHRGFRWALIEKKTEPIK